MPTVITGVNRQSELARGLARLIVFNRGAAPVDLVSGKPLTVVSTAIEQNYVGSQGVGSYVLNDATSYWTIPVATETVLNFSIGFVGRLDAGVAPMIMRDSTSSNGTIVGFINAGQWFTRIGGVTLPSVGTATLKQEIRHVTSYGAGANASVVVNGIVIASGLTGAGTIALVSPWCVMQNGTFGTGAQGYCALLPIWDRKISDAEAVRFTENPWQLVE